MIPEEIDSLICRDLYTGRIMRKAGSLDLFFITEKEDREDFIRDQALQLIMCDWGYTTFSFYQLTMKKANCIIQQKQTGHVRANADKQGQLS